MWRVMVVRFWKLSHSTFFEVDTLEGTNTSCEEPQGDILDLVITKELYVSISIA